VAIPAATQVSYARIKVDGADAIIRPLDDGGPRKLVIMRIYAVKPEAKQCVLRAVHGLRRGLPRTVRDLPRLGLAGVSCAALHTCSAPTAAAPYADRGSAASRLSRAFRCGRLGRSIRPIPTTVVRSQRCGPIAVTPHYLRISRWPHQRRAQSPPPFADNQAQ
jgi:hypothetical protein